MNTIYVYAMNTREIYDVYAMLSKQVANRIKSNKPVEVDHLAKCSTMDKIIRMTVKYAAKYGETCSTEEKNEARKMFAEAIIEDANYMTENK